ncbi:DUF2281 domain-containing protein [Leptolyngbya sp. FACHB-17]|uniref:DUF2281 domain-containing protein n=1 Tax=unclassified Leptolyngbya TaxID=2650499 RepID=UPI00168181DC|nr:DUF2281 domain-containing protein [Leptolyngbya sp. FACHB-17]MBD2080168.1 DUF2281 domain-containing protein [Leptolyngbya sp. FACHB-17]
MDNQATQATGLPEKILEALSTLSLDRQQQVFDFVEFLIQKQENSEVRPPIQQAAEPSKKRILGQHQGLGWMSEDFNNPLPDEFWLGDEST